MNKLSKEKFKCPICGMKFRNKFAYIEHVKRHKLWFKSYNQRR